MKTSKNKSMCRTRRCRRSGGAGGPRRRRRRRRRRSAAAAAAVAFRRARRRRRRAFRRRWRRRHRRRRRRRSRRRRWASAATTTACAATKRRRRPDAAPPLRNNTQRNQQIDQWAAWSRVDTPQRYIALILRVINYRKGSLLLYTELIRFGLVRGATNRVVVSGRCVGIVGVGVGVGVGGVGSGRRFAFGHRRQVRFGRDGRMLAAGRGGGVVGGRLRRTAACTNRIVGNRRKGKGSVEETRTSAPPSGKGAN